MGRWRPSPRVPDPSATSTCPGVVRAYGLHSTTLGLTLEGAGGQRRRIACARSAPGCRWASILARSLRASGAHRRGDPRPRRRPPRSQPQQHHPRRRRGRSPPHRLRRGHASRAGRSRARPAHRWHRQRRLRGHRHVERQPRGAAGGTLGYLSPEQTGRMNRPVDRRTGSLLAGGACSTSCSTRAAAVRRGGRAGAHPRRRGLDAHAAGRGAGRRARGRRGPRDEAPLQDAGGSLPERRLVGLAAPDPQNVQPPLAAPPAPCPRCRWRRPITATASPCRTSSTAAKRSGSCSRRRCPRRARATWSAWPCSAPPGRGRRRW